MNLNRGQDAAERLSQAIRFPTVSHSESSDDDVGVFLGFQDWLRASYPLCAREELKADFGPYAMLFRFKGNNHDAEPMILLAHYDVVPAQEGVWTQAPFGGVVDGGFIWGRGAIDVKNTVVSVMEAMEGLLRVGEKPSRDVYVAFGGDEEVGGNRGAGRIAAHLASLGLKAGCLIDEGAIIGTDILRFIGRPVALIGISEKGFMHLKLEVRGKSGHASMPSGGGAVARLAKLILALERRPLRPRLSHSLRLFLGAMAKASPPHIAFAFSHPRLCWPIIKSAFSKWPRADALLRSTQAFTMISASDKENVLPESASIILNIRCLPGDTSSAILRRYQRIARAYGASASIHHPEHLNEAMAESDTESPAYRLIVESLAKILPDALALPFLVTVSTDTRHYAGLARDIFRFTPICLSEEEIALVHGVDERISIANLGLEISFYEELIRA